MTVIYITKYALSKGVLTVDANIDYTGVASYKIHNTKTFHKPGSYFLSLIDAVNKANEMRSSAIRRKPEIAEKLNKLFYSFPIELKKKDDQMAKPIGFELLEEDIQAYIKRTTPTSRIARKHKCSKKTIMYKLKKLNRDDVNARILENTHISQKGETLMSKTAEILDLYDSGKKLSDMATLFGVSVPTLWKHISVHRPDDKRGENTKRKKLTNTAKCLDELVRNPQYAQSVKIPISALNTPHRMMTISMRQQQCSA